MRILGPKEVPDVGLTQKLRFSSENSEKQKRTCKQMLHDPRMRKIDTAAAKNRKTRDLALFSEQRPELS